MRVLTLKTKQNTCPQKLECNYYALSDTSSKKMCRNLKKGGRSVNLSQYYEHMVYVCIHTYTHTHTYSSKTNIHICIHIYKRPPTRTPIHEALHRNLVSIASPAFHLSDSHILLPSFPHNLHFSAFRREIRGLLKGDPVCD